MSIEDFKMYEEWSAYRETVLEEAVEQPAPVVLATWARRFGAYLIDNLILSVPLVLYFFSSLPAEIASLGSMSVDPVTGQPDPAAMESLMGSMMALQFRMYLIYVVVATLYYVVCHGTTGQTMGKMALGIRLIKADGSRAGWGEAAKRAIVNPIVQIVPFVGGLLGILNGLWPLWDEKNQSLGDKAARTLVVYD